MEERDLLRTVAAHWDGRAATFDDEPDHGLRDPAVRAAWASRLDSWIPGDAQDVLDVGCGTGSLALLLAERGHRVRGIDLSEEMVSAARIKAHEAGSDVGFDLGDAGNPSFPDGSFDVVLVRHLVWTLPDPVVAIARWVALLKPTGRLVLVEGRWSQPDADDVPADRDHGDYTDVHADLRWYGGAPSSELAAAIIGHLPELTVEDLAVDSTLWGREVTDERYAIVATGR